MRLTLLLSNDNDRAVIDPASGGRLASLQIGGEEVLVTEGSGATEWGCYPMAPWAGRIRDGRFVWSDEARQVPINWPPHALHGTVFDSSWEITEPGAIRCKLGSTWPWPGEVRSYFELNAGELFWRLEVHTETDEFPVVVGWHPWFRRQLSDGSPAKLSFNPTEMYERDDTGIPTGKRVVPTPGPWDDCFTGVAYSPILTWANGLNVEVSSSCDHWVVYDQPEHAICVEPQSGPPDAFNLEGFAIARPSQPVCHTMRLRWWKSEE